MPFTLTMPKLSPTMEEGTIAKWRVQEGAFVKSGDVLIEVATDKATVEYAAVDKGYLRKILIKAGDSAVINQPIAIFTAQENESIEGYVPEGIAPSQPESKTAGANEAEGSSESKPQAAWAKKETLGMAMPAFVPEAPLEAFDFEQLKEQGSVVASPYARKLAKEKNLDLSSVKGSGPHGRIVSDDLKTAQVKGLVSAFKHDIDTEVMPGSFTEEKLSPMRKVIGQRLQESKTFIPHFYVTYDIDMQPLADLRNQLATSSIKLSVNDFVVKAASIALEKHPRINSGFNSVTQSIVKFQTIDIAIAVSLEDGLITPIVRLANHKKVAHISREIKELATRAKAGKLDRHEYVGGSFTISNLGMFGASNFIGVINPPQAAILCVSGAHEKPVCKNGQVVPGLVMSVTLCSDHRVIDGADAAKFLQTFKSLLENPSLLLF
jgi:pyruvate dehydrogenase E2 component (dihydrolipoamide acetyltransferase)